MTSEQEDAGEIREFRLEGATLVVVAVVLVVALAGAFYVGRLVERKSQPAGTFATGSAEDPLANVAQTEDPADVDESSDFFDAGEAAQGELEPEREVRRGLGQPEEGDSPAAGIGSRATRSTRSELAVSKPRTRPETWPPSWNKRAIAEPGSRPSADRFPCDILLRLGRVLAGPGSQGGSNRGHDRHPGTIRTGRDAVHEGRRVAEVPLMSRARAASSPRSISG
jgi:hypothetical protein